MYKAVKCKKCRKLIFDENECSQLLLNSHKSPLRDLTGDCVVENVIFLNEDYLPQWIKDRIDAEEWSKGRINCQFCDNRIGAFDFVSGLKCTCSEFVLPSVHVNISKIDLIK